MTKCKKVDDTYSKAAKLHAQNQHYARAHYMVTGILFTCTGTNMGYVVLLHGKKFALYYYSYIKKFITTFCYLY